MRLKELIDMTRPAWVWVLRVALGATFIASGLAKSIDIWGTVFKMEEYLQVWGWQCPRTLVMLGSMILCGGEFVLGSLLLLGTYRRASVILLSLLMAGMLPLSLWIWIADPVSDCGCFGDMLLLSNRATFWKNVAICAGLACLWGANRKVGGAISPYPQWIAGAVLTVYVAIVALVGYNIQPLADFRRFPVGTPLTPDAQGLADDADTEAEPRYVFVYRSAGGDVREFPDDGDLPDSTWTFIERRLVAGSEAPEADRFVLLDGDTDITADVIAPEGVQLLVVVPEINRVNPSHTYAINTLDRYISGRGGSLAALLAPDDGGTGYWNDIAMPRYPVVTAEPQMLKELVRGNVGLVCLVDGRVAWKRSLASVDTLPFDNPSTAPDLATLEPPATGFLGKLTVALLILLGIIIVLDRTGVAIHWFWKRKKHKKTSTPPSAD